MYEALYKPNQLIYGTGKPVIVTGWTPAKQVAKQLDESDYAAIGQLYCPKRGINFLIRNLLWNPQVIDLIILDATREDKNSGACECLFDFFVNGFELCSNKWKIKSKIDGYIDTDINKGSLDVLRSYLCVHYAKNISELKEYLKYSVLKRKPKIPSLSPIKFPYSEPETSSFPSSIYGQTVTGETIAETWVKIIHRIRTNGVLRPTGYDGQWQELQVLTAVVNNEPGDFYFPEPNYLPLDRDYLTNYIPQILDDAPYSKGVKYTYGQRITSWFGRDQKEDVINKLVKEPDAASAVINLWDSGSGGGSESFSSPVIARYGRKLGDGDHQYGGSPCLNHLWFRIADDKLTLAATFRSNDMFSAWPSNAMGLRALQKYILEQINSRGGYSFGLGPLITVSDSAHIYDDCFENADSLVKNQYNKLISKRDYFDLVGNFIVGIENGEITLEWTTPTGDLIKSYRAKKAIKLRQAIELDCPTMSIGNALYLGDRLNDAENRLVMLTSVASWTDSITA